MARETCPTMLMINFVPRARLGELRDQRVAVIAPPSMKSHIFQGPGSPAPARC